MRLLIMSEPTERELKTKFAEALLKNPDDAQACAFQVFDSPGQALQLAYKWASDPEVLAIRDELIEKNGLRSYLPSKEQQAKDIYVMAEDIKLDTESRLKAHRLYAEIMGNIEKPVQTNLNTQVNVGVMLVPMAANDEDWEQRAQHQQKTLIAGANVSTEQVN